MVYVCGVMKFFGLFYDQVLYRYFRLGPFDSLSFWTNRSQPQTGPQPELSKGTPEGRGWCGLSLINHLMSRWNCSCTIYWDLKSIIICRSLRRHHIIGHGIQCKWRGTGPVMRQGLLWNTSWQGWNRIKEIPCLRQGLLMVLVRFLSLCLPDPSQSTSPCTALCFPVLEYNDADVLQ